MGVRVRSTVYRDRVLREASAASLDQRRKIADQVVDRFRSTATVRTGEYRSGASVSVEGDRVFVENNDPEAFYKEYGTSRTRAHADLTNAARQFGKYRGFQPRGGRR